MWGKLINKLNLIYQYIIKKIKCKYCPVCYSLNIDRGLYTRGWNNLCEQACGGMGDRCFDCGHIEWDESYEKYKTGLPNWCEAYR